MIIPTPIFEQYPKFERLLKNNEISIKSKTIKVVNFLIKELSIVFHPDSPIKDYLNEKNNLVDAHNNLLLISDDVCALIDGLIDSYISMYGYDQNICFNLFS